MSFNVRSNDVKDIFHLSPCPKGFANSWQCSEESLEGKPQDSSDDEMKISLRQQEFWENRCLQHSFFEQLFSFIHLKNYDSSCFEPETLAKVPTKRLIKIFFTHNYMYNRDVAKGLSKAIADRFSIGNLYAKAKEKEFFYVTRIDPGVREDPNCLQDANSLQFSPSYSLSEKQVLHMQARIRGNLVRKKILSYKEICKILAEGFKGEQGKNFCKKISLYATLLFKKFVFFYENRKTFEDYCQNYRTILFYPRDIEYCVPEFCIGVNKSHFVLQFVGSKLTEGNFKEIYPMIQMQVDLKKRKEGRITSYQNSVLWVSRATDIDLLKIFIGVAFQQKIHEELKDSKIGNVAESGIFMGQQSIEETSLCYFHQKRYDMDFSIAAWYGLVSDEEKMKIVIVSARQIQQMHKHGIVHKDIKAGNILLDKNNDQQGYEAHVNDFDLTTHTHYSIEVPKEKLQGDPNPYLYWDHSLQMGLLPTLFTDVYSFAVVLMEAYFPQALEELYKMSWLTRGEIEKLLVIEKENSHLKGVKTFILEIIDKSLDFYSKRTSSMDPVKIPLTVESFIERCEKLLAAFPKK